MAKDPALFEGVLRLADDHLILSHRLSQWCGHAPMLEEDLALPNIALDLMGQARTLYTYAGEIEGAGRDEDQLAYMRGEREFKNLLITERPNGDFAHTILKQLYFSIYMTHLWKATQTSSDSVLRDIAEKALPESTYHVRHTSEWVIRLGDGTKESTTRTIDAMDQLAPFVNELFIDDDITRALDDRDVLVNPSTLNNAWTNDITAVMQEARLDTNNFERVQQTPGLAGGREGQHTEAHGYLLAELQYVQRAYPGQKW